MSGCDLDPLFETGEKHMVLPLGALVDLPPCFESTLLGNPKGSLSQLRCFHGYHMRIYTDRIEIHKDRVDPRVNPVGHIALDTALLQKGAGLGALFVVCGIVRCKRWLDSR
jgi:hypothetical protein